jgi:phage-related protein
MQAKLQRAFRLVGARGLPALAMPLARPTDGRIWEFRVTGRDGTARSLYAASTGLVLLVLRTFVIKTPKTPRGEIEIARRRIAEEEHGTN